MSVTLKVTTPLAGNAWLMLHGTEPVAAAIIYPKAAFHDSPPGNFHLYVVPRFSKHGIGSRLLDHLQIAATERGHPVLETTVAAEDDRSTRFLLNHGFSAVGRSIHLALLDMHMPALTGLETLQMVRQINALLPCILVTADVTEWLMRQALRARRGRTDCRRSRSFPL